MVLTAQEQAARTSSPVPSRLAPRDDILWDDEPEQNEESLPADLTPLGSGADDRRVLCGAVTR